MHSILLIHRLSEEVKYYNQPKSNITKWAKTLNVTIAKNGGSYVYHNICCLIKLEICMSSKGNDKWYLMLL